MIVEFTPRMIGANIFLGMGISSGEEDGGGMEHVKKMSEGYGMLG